MTNTFYRLTRALMNEDDEGPDVDLQLAALQEHLTAMSILGFKEHPGTPLFADDTSLKGKLCHLLSCRQQYGIDSLDDKVGGMSTQEYCFYKILGGKVVRRLKSVTDIYKYVRLLESNNSAEALTLIGSESPIIRKLAGRILEGA